MCYFNLFYFWDILPIVISLCMHHKNYKIQDPVLSFYEVSEHSVMSGEETDDLIKLSSLGSQDGNEIKFESEKANKTVSE